MNRVIRNVLMTCGFILGAMGGCTCDETQSSTDCATGKAGVESIYLQRAPAASGGELMYVGAGSQLPSRCENRADSFSVEGSPYAVAFLAASESRCAESMVVLGPDLTGKVKTTPADMMHVFGDLHPKLPLSFKACVAAAATPPQVIAVYLHYTTK